MAAYPTIAETIVYADISTGLCANYNASGALWGTRVIPPASPMTIAIVTDALRWGSSGGAQDAETLRNIRNYLLWLIGMFGMDAKRIVSGGGGGTVVPSPTISRPIPLDFIVSATSVIATGATGATLSAFAGWNLQFDRGGITQNTTNVGDGSSYYGWVVASGTFSCSPALQEGELVRLTPV